MLDEVGELLLELVVEDQDERTTDAPPDVAQVALEESYGKGWDYL